MRACRLIGSAVLGRLGPGLTTQSPSVPLSAAPSTGGAVDLDFAIRCSDFRLAPAGLLQRLLGPFRELLRLRPHLLEPLTP